MNKKESVGTYALATTVVSAVVGIGIFSYPKQLAQQIGSDGWIVTAVAGLIALLLVYLAYRIIVDNGYAPFMVILNNNFGKILGGGLALVFVLHGVFNVAIGMRIFVEVLKMYLLEKTPVEFILIVMILTGVYVVRGEVDSLVKFNEIVFWFMFIPAFVVVLFTLNIADFTNILPIFTHKPIDYISATKAAVYGFGGFEVIYLLLPYIRKKEGVFPTLVRSILFITVFYVVIIIFTLAVFGVEQSKSLLWPTITMVKSIDIQGTFIERWEGIVMTLWVMFYFTTFINIFYFSSDIVKNVFHLEHTKLSSFIIIPFIYAIALYPQNIAEVYDIQSKVSNISSVLVYVLIPVVLFFVSRWKRKGGTARET